MKQSIIEDNIDIYVKCSICGNKKMNEGNNICICCGNTEWNKSDIPSMIENIRSYNKKHGVNK